jgi:hypothetical protein
MIKSLLSFSLFLLLFVTFVPLGYALDEPPSADIPYNMGVSIQNTPMSGAWDFNLLARTGAKIVRVDLVWYKIERQRGIYSFEEFDTVIESLLSRGIRPYISLGFGNDLYGEYMSVRSQEGLKAFASFAKAAATRYRGKKVIWELWNEPNLDVFWRPKASSDEFMTYVRTVAPVIREADPEAIIAGPALSNTITTYMENCLAKGLLKYVDAVSVHPYQNFPTNQVPEAGWRQLDQLRERLKRYAALAGKSQVPPVFFSEWGYSWEGTANSNLSEEVLAQYTARQLLLGVLYKIPVNIIYSWKNARHSPCTTKDKCYGLVTRELVAKRSYAYYQNVGKELSGYRFVRRLESQPRDYYMLFTRKGDSKVVAWTIDPPHTSMRLPNGACVQLSGKPVFVSMRPTKR